MNFNGMFADVFAPVYANDISALIPELWAQEGLLLLQSNMVAANLVHRDFENLVASFGETVNTRLPATFVGKRKTDADAVTVQDVNLTNVAVKLDQHAHVSFLIRDGEESKSFQSLRDTHLEPSMLALAEMIDEIVLMNVYDFMLLDGGESNVVGSLASAASKESLISVREKMNDNRVPMSGRNLILSSGAEADLLNVELFTAAEKVGDNGTALREANLGRKFGIDHFMSQNVPSFSAAAANKLVDLAVNNAAGYPAGTTTLTIDGRAAATAIPNGAWVKIAGDDTPQRVTASVGGTTPTSITITPGLDSAVADDAAIVEYVAAAINFGAGYAAGYAKDIVVDGVTAAPKTGQLVTFSAAAGLVSVYGLLRTPTSTSVLLNRPLDAAVIDDDTVALGPDGSYSFGFQKNAMALVSRPLAAPAPGTGALSFTAAFEGLAMRITITYDGSQQGHLVTADLLLGIKTLDRRLGCVLLSA